MPPLRRDRTRVSRHALIVDLAARSQYTGHVRTAFVVLMLSAPAVWATPPTARTVEAKKTTPAKAEPRKAEAPKTDAPKLDRQPTRKAAPVTSTLSLKKKPSHRVMLADWAP